MPAATHESDELTVALTSAVGTLLGVDPEQVRVEVYAPGLDEVAGPFTVRIDTAPDAPPPSPADEAPSSQARDSSDDAEDEAPHDGVSTTDDASEEATDEVTPEQLDEEAEAAADFLEGMLDAFDLPGDLRIKILEDHAEVEIAEMGTGTLIGRRGQTLDAIQELVRCALQRRFERRTRVQIDAEAYRARRLERLQEKAEDAVEEALASGTEVRLEPMDVFERKAIHGYVATVDGVTSRSHGREPGRRVVIAPEGDEA